MMRKYVAIAAILFLAPAASALTASLSFTGDLPAGGIVELSIFGATYDPIIAMVSEPGVLTNFRRGPAAPPEPPHVQPAIIDGLPGELWHFMSVPGAPYQDGVWLIADWSSAIPVWVGAYETIDTMSWIVLDRVQVPEPMTLALLGLGGLFLLRRRK